MHYEVLIKEDEKRVFFFIYERKPKEGETPVVPPRVKLDAYASIAKADWEEKNGVTLYDFKYDPMAGGQRPMVPPKGQVWRPLIEQNVAFNPASGPKINEKFLEQGGKSNLNAGYETMVSTGLWVGVYL